MQLGFFDNLNPAITDLTFNFMNLSQLPELPDSAVRNLADFSYGVGAREDTSWPA